MTGIYKNMRRGIIALVFRCRIVEGEPGATTEVQEAAWLAPAEVQQRMDEAYATRLLDALQPGPVAIRAHDGLSLLPTQSAWDGAKATLAVGASISHRAQGGSLWPAVVACPTTSRKPLPEPSRT